jgi:hypothetical protein
MKKTRVVPTDGEIRGQLAQYLDITNGVDVPPRIREITAASLNDRPRLARILLGGGAVLALAAATAVLVLVAHTPRSGPVAVGSSPSPTATATATATPTAAPTVAPTLTTTHLLTLATSPSVGSSSVLRAVACPSSSDCWAVGSYDVSPEEPLIEHYSGGTWATVAGPDVTGGNFEAISCPAVDACWAVGGGPTQALGGSTPALVEQYSGSSWTVMASPAPNATLVTIACPAVGECWALGLTRDGGAPVLEQLSGGNWTVVTAPQLPLGDSLISVACPTVDDCWAVGLSSFALHYTGAGWSEEDISTIVGTGGYLRAVTCPDASHCWAVGANGSGQPLLADYSASGWALEASPVTASGEGLGGGGSGTGGGLACDAAGDCWTITEGAIPPDGTGHAGLANFNGTASVFDSGPTLAAGDALSDVACPVAGECWAVGYSGGDSYTAAGAPPSVALIETSVAP